MLFYYWLPSLTLSLSFCIFYLNSFFLAVSRSGDSKVHSTTLDSHQEKRPRKGRRNGRREAGPRGLGPAAAPQHQRADGAQLHAHQPACPISHSIASSPAGTELRRLLLLSLLAHLAPGIPSFATSASSSSPAAAFACKGRLVSNRGASAVGQESREEECRRRRLPLPAWPFYPSLL